MPNNNSFRPAWWLPGAHLQTVFPTLTRRALQISTRQERLELPDGDFVDLEWVGESEGPIVVMLHGLAGNINSPYAKGMLQVLISNGWRGVFMHFRGCSGVPNRMAHSYHSGETGDLAFLIAELQRREQQTQLAAIGFSLGGNVLLKWLGETGGANPLRAAIAISVPFELQKTANYFNQGISRFYQWWLLRDLRSNLRQKFPKEPAPIEMENLDNFRTFWEFDNHVTAPLNGFNDAEDYYQRSSSRQFLCHITVPTLIVHSKDDPMVPEDALPRHHELSPQVSLEVTAGGGHIGFVSGNVPWQPIYWLEQRIAGFLQGLLKL